MKSDKFNETNWISFKNLIIMAAKVQDTMGYLYKTIKDSLHLIKSTVQLNSESEGLPKPSTTK